MTEHICTRAEEIKALEIRGNDLQSQIHKIQLKDVEKEKDMERYQDSLDRLNSTLDELKIMIEDINNKPVEKYEKIWNTVAGGVIGAVVAFVMGVVLS